MHKSLGGQVAYSEARPGIWTPWSSPSVPAAHSSKEHQWPGSVSICNKAVECVWCRHKFEGARMNQKPMQLTFYLSLNILICNLSVVVWLVLLLLCNVKNYSFISEYVIGSAARALESFQSDFLSPCICNYTILPNLISSKFHFQWYFVCAQSYWEHTHFWWIKFRFWSDDIISSNIYTFWHAFTHHLSVRLGCADGRWLKSDYSRDQLLGSDRLGKIVLKNCIRIVMGRCCGLSCWSFILAGVKNSGFLCNIDRIIIF